MHVNHRVRSPSIPIRFVAFCLAQFCWGLSNPAAAQEPGAAPVADGAASMQEAPTGVPGQEDATDEGDSNRDERASSEEMETDAGSDDVASLGELIPLFAEKSAGAQICGMVVRTAGEQPMPSPAEVLAAALFPTSASDAGVLGDELAVELQRSVCAAADAGRWFPQLCAPLSAPDTLGQLRARALLDALALPLPFLELSHGGGLQLARARSFFETVAGRAPCSGLAEAGRAILARPEPERDRALFLMLSLVAAMQASDPKRAVTDSVVFLSLAQAEIGNTAAEATSESIATLKKRSKEIEEGLSPAQRSALTRLRSELGGATGAIPPAGSSGAWLLGRLRHWIEAYRQASLVVGPAIAAPGAAESEPSWSRLLDTLGALEQGALVDAMRPWLAGEVGAVAGGGGAPAVPIPWSLPEQAIELLERVERFLQAPDENARWRVVRGAVLGLGTWVDHWVLDASVGTAFVDVDEGDYGLSADLTLGWQAERWGVVASGATRAYQTTGERVYEDMDRNGANLEAWFASDPSVPFAFEGRISFGVLDYASNRFLASGQFDEISTMLRSGLLAGARFESEAFGVGLWAGAGGQYEYFDSIDFRAQSQEVRDDVGLTFEARLRARWSFWPRMLVLRALVEGTRVGITRQRATLDLATGASSSDGVKWAQLEASGRSYLDLELARFFDFVPALTGGMDWMHRSADAERETSWVPVVGAGVRRLWY